MKVFITGATGYIGFAVAQAVRRAGHEVWGLTRSQEKGKRLQKFEIQPVIGDMDEPESYLEIAEQCSLLVHAAADYEHDTEGLDKKTLRTLISAGNRGVTPKTLIYTSGCWVLGDTGIEKADECTTLNPTKNVKWRPDHEKLVVHSEYVHGIVMRPGCVYGRQGGLTGMWFKGAENGNLRAIGDGSNYWSMVHVEDVADAYVRAAEKRVSGEIFNISDRSRNTVREMIESVASVTNYEGEIHFTPVEKARQKMGPVAEALALNQHLDARKAVDLLRWYPQFGGFVDEARLFYQSWKAYQ